MATITSTQSGEWSSGSTWVGGTAPGNGDVAIIAHDVTHSFPLTLSIRVGTSDVSGTAAITINSGASLTIGPSTYAGAGYVLICQGDLDVSAADADGALTINPGCRLEFDDQNTVSGDETYDLILPRQVTNHATPALKVRGTASNRAWIRKHPSGTANPLITGHASLTYTGLVDAEYCTFSNVGTASTHALYAYVWFDSKVRLVNCTFDNCGQVRVQLYHGDNHVEIENCNFTNPLNTTACLHIGATAAITTGTRAINHSVFGNNVNLYGGKDFSIDDNHFVEGFLTTNYQWASFTNNFVDKDSFQSVTIQGSIADNFWFKRNASVANPHFILALEFSPTIDGDIFQSNGTDEVGDCIKMGIPSSASVVTIRNAISAINGGGGASGCLVAALGGANISYGVENCSGFVQQGLINTNETYIGYANMLTSAKGLLAIGNGDGYLIRDLHDQTMTDYISSGNATNNCAYNITEDYSRLEFSSGSPGANDVDEDPQLVDQTRTVATWDAANGGPGTVANALIEMQKMNDTDFDSNYTQSNLMAYIREGWRPQNASLDGADHNGATIGAVAYVADSGSSGTLAIGLGIRI